MRYPESILPLDQHYDKRKTIPVTYKSGKQGLQDRG